MGPGARFPLSDSRLLRLALYAGAACFCAAALSMLAKAPRWSTAVPAALLTVPAATFAALGRTVRGGYAELGEDALQVRLGWLFDATVPYEAIAGVEMMPTSWLWGLGVRTNLVDTVAVLTSTRGVVEVTFNRRVSLPLIPFIWRFPARKLRLSLEQPRDFVAALGLAVGPRRDAGVEPRAGGA